MASEPTRTGATIRELAKEIELLCRAADQHASWIDGHWDMTNEDSSALREAIRRIRAALEGTR